jgi:hypothetical protein
MILILVKPINIFKIFFVKCGTRFLLMLVFMFLLTSSDILTGQGIEFPVPPSNPKHLFYLQRPANTNTLIYELNAENGVPDKKKPIHVFWISYAKNGQKEELSGLEKRYAYGVKVTELAEGQFEFYLVSCKYLKLLLKQGDDKFYHVYANINNKLLMVSRIYIEVKGGSLFKPNIDYVDVKGIDTISGSETEERIKFKDLQQNKTN